MWVHMRRIRVILAAVAVPVTVAALVLTAQGAQASTPECLNGTYHGYCGTQIDNGTPALVLDNSKQRAAVTNPGNGHVVLRQCNGSDWQRWIATQVGTTSFFTWKNRATHRILQSGARGAQL